MKRDLARSILQNVMFESMSDYSCLAYFPISRRNIVKASWKKIPLRILEQTKMRQRPKK